MRVLAFDACHGAVSAAAGHVHPDGRWGEFAGEFQAIAGGHAEALMPMIGRVVAAAGLDFKRLDRIIATLGPGGFTGVRVSVSAARAFILATGAKGIGLSALEALALGARQELGAELDGRELAVAVDGRRGMVFFADGIQVPFEKPELLAIADAAQRLEGRRIIVVGSGAQAVVEAGAADATARLPNVQPDARLFGRLCAHVAPLHTLKPLYLRPPDAKAQTSFVLPRASA